MIYCPTDDKSNGFDYLYKSKYQVKYMLELKNLACFIFRSGF